MIKSQTANNRVLAKNISAIRRCSITNLKIRSSREVLCRFECLASVENLQRKRMYLLLALKVLNYGMNEYLKNYNSTKEIFKNLSAYNCKYLLYYTRSTCVLLLHVCMCVVYSRVRMLARHLSHSAPVWARVVVCYSCLHHIVAWRTTRLLLLYNNFIKVL